MTIASYRHLSAARAALQEDAPSAVTAPLRLGETLEQRLVRFEGDLDKAKHQATLAARDVDNAIVALGECDDIMSREKALAHVDAVRATKGDADLIVLAHQRKVDALRAKIADPAMRQLAGRLEEQRPLATREELQRRVREELAPRALAAFREAVAIGVRANELLAEIRSNVSDLSATADALGERIDPPFLEIDQARSVIAQAIDAMVEEEKLSSSAAFEWLQPRRGY